MRLRCKRPAGRLLPSAGNSAGSSGGDTDDTHPQCHSRDFRKRTGLAQGDVGLLPCLHSPLHTRSSTQLPILLAFPGSQGPKPNASLSASQPFFPPQLTGASGANESTTCPLIVWVHVFPVTDTPSSSPGPLLTFDIGAALNPRPPFNTQTNRPPFPAWKEKSARTPPALTLAWSHFQQRSSPKLPDPHGSPHAPQLPAKRCHLTWVTNTALLTRLAVTSPAPSNTPSTPPPELLSKTKRAIHSVK